MIRYALLFVIVLSCSGCAMMEDMVLGPEPTFPDYGIAAQPTGGCANGAPHVTAIQTAEPELLKR